MRFAQVGSSWCGIGAGQAHRPIRAAVIAQNGAHSIAGSLFHENDRLDAQVPTILDGAARAVPPSTHCKASSQRRRSETARHHARTKRSFTHWPKSRRKNLAGRIAIGGPFSPALPAAIPRPRIAIHRVQKRRRHSRGGSHQQPICSENSLPLPRSSGWKAAGGIRRFG